MEVILHACQGIPDGSVLSIRAGHNRRQAPLEVGKALKFPADSGPSSDLQVDILKVLGRAKVSMDGSTRIFKVPLDSTGDMNCDLEVRHGTELHSEPKDAIAAKAEAPRAAVARRPPDAAKERSSSRRHEAALTAQRYMEKHQIVPAVQAVMQDTVTRRLDDPLTAMAEALLAIATKNKAAAQQARGGTWQPPAGEVGFKASPRSQDDGQGSARPSSARKPSFSDRLRQDVESAKVDKAAPEATAEAVQVTPEKATPVAEVAQAKLEAEQLASEQAAAAVKVAAAERAAAEEAAAAEPSVAEKAEQERAEAERLEAEKLAAEKAAAEKAEQERAEAERLEAEKLAAEKAAAEKAEQERAEAERLEAEKLAAEKAADEKAEQERAEAERLEAEKLAAEKAAAEKAEQERAEAERLEAEKLAAEKAAAEKEQDAGNQLERTQSLLAEIAAHAERKADVLERAATERFLKAEAAKESVATPSVEPQQEQANDLDRTSSLLAEIAAHAERKADALERVQTERFAREMAEKEQSSQASACPEMVPAEPSEQQAATEMATAETVRQEKLAKQIAAERALAESIAEQAISTAKRELSVILTNPEDAEPGDAAAGRESAAAAAAVVGSTRASTEIAEVSEAGSCFGMAARGIAAEGLQEVKASLSQLQVVEDLAVRSDAPVGMATPAASAVEPVSVASTARCGGSLPPAAGLDDCGTPLCATPAGSTASFVAAGLAESSMDQITAELMAFAGQPLEQAKQPFAATDASASAGYAELQQRMSTLLQRGNATDSTSASATATPSAASLNLQGASVTGGTLSSMSSCRREASSWPPTPGTYAARVQRQGPEEALRARLQACITDCALAGTLPALLAQAAEAAEAKEST